MRGGSASRTENSEVKRTGYLCLAEGGGAPATHVNRSLSLKSSADNALLAVNWFFAKNADDAQKQARLKQIIPLVLQLLA